MGSLESRLGAVEEALIDSLIVQMLVVAELQAMLTVLETSEAIERPLYEKVAHIVSSAQEERWQA
jgi:hypothetical protein